MNHFLILDWNLILLKHLLVFHVEFLFFFIFNILVHWYFCMHQIPIYPFYHNFLQMHLHQPAHQIPLYIFINIFFKCILIPLSSYSFFLFSFLFDSFFGCFCNEGLSSSLYKPILPVRWCYLNTLKKYYFTWYCRIITRNSMGMILHRKYGMSQIVQKMY